MSVAKGDKVFLHTIGDGDDGNEWNVHGIYSTREKAENAATTRQLASGRKSTVEEWVIDSEEAQ